MHQKTDDIFVHALYDRVGCRAYIVGVLLGWLGIHKRTVPSRDTLRGHGSDARVIAPCQSLLAQ